VFLLEASNTNMFEGQEKDSFSLILYALVTVSQPATALMVIENSHRDEFSLLKLSVKHLLMQRLIGAEIALTIPL